jgi:hypothetical protein
VTRVWSGCGRVWLMRLQKIGTRGEMLDTRREEESRRRPAGLPLDCAATVLVREEGLEPSRLSGTGF